MKGSLLLFLTACDFWPCDFPITAAPSVAPVTAISSRRDKRPCIRPRAEGTTGAWGIPGWREGGLEPGTIRLGEIPPAKSRSNGRKGVNAPSGRLLLYSFTQCRYL